MEKVDEEEEDMVVLRPQSYSMATWPMDVKVFETYIDSVLSPIQKEYATQLMTVFVPLQSD